MHHACERRIIIRTGLDIYGCLLNQSAFGQMLQNGRTSSVGIQFDGIPEGMYFADKSSRSEARVGSPPEIQTPSRFRGVFSGKRALLLPGITGSSAGCSTRELFWQNGQRKLQLPRKIVAATLPG